MLTEDEGTCSGLRRDAVADGAGTLTSLDKLSEASYSPLRELIGVQKSAARRREPTVSSHLSLGLTVKLTA